MFFAFGPTRTCLVFSAVAIQASLLSSLACPQVSEGCCRKSSDPTTVEICASGAWRQMYSGPYECIAGTMVPRPVKHVVIQTASIATSAGLPSIVRNGPAISTTGVSLPPRLANTTGNAYCSGLRLQRRLDQWGQASYRTGGKMASTYHATPESPFRCNRAPPPDGYYVALWTRYQDGQSSQPPPTNCNQTLALTNPRLGKTADATVIDRCASCVGVGRQLDDPTTPDCLVNGATVDLSRALWDFLFDGAPPTVYDIEYSGSVYAGWNTDPPWLTTRSAAECSCG